MYHVIVTYIVGLKGLNGTKGLNLSPDVEERSVRCQRIVNMIDLRKTIFSPLWFMFRRWYDEISNINNPYISIE